MTALPPQMHLPTGADPRQSHLLDAVREAFVEKGFDGASMQDLARAAGISVGNFYRYFPSKDAIIEAIVMRDLADVQQEFATIIQSDDPLTTLRGVLYHHIEGACGGDCPLMAEITAAARRKPQIGAVLRRLEDGIRGYLIAVFAAVTGLALDESARRYGGHAALIMMLVKANGMRVPAVDGNETDLNVQILRTINRALDEIELDAVKG